MTFDNILSIGFPAFGTIFAIAIFLLLLHNFFCAIASKKWPSTPGIILEISLENRGKKNETPFYIAKVKYSYLVEGVLFTSTLKAFHMNHKNDFAFVQTHPKGTEVTVYFNPKKPALAVLEPGTSFYTYLLLFLSAFAVFIAIYILFKHLT